MRKEAIMKTIQTNRWKKCAALAAGIVMLSGLLGGCGSGGQTTVGDNAGHDQESYAAGSGMQESSTTAAAGNGAGNSQTQSIPASSGEMASGNGTGNSQAQSIPASSGEILSGREAVTVRIGSLKGPTSLGLLNLMEKASNGETTDTYEFQMATGADELLPLMVKGELDIALVPANVAAVLYQKTDGGVEVININTLGVLYMVTGTSQVNSVADLKGKTIYLTGKGTTPEASLRYIMDANGLAEEDVTLEFKSEAAEVAAVLAEDSDAVGLLPQPFVTAACLQNDSLKVVLDINEEWTKLQEASSDNQGGGMVTGVTVVRKAFLEEHPEAVEEFLKEHKDSTAAINEDPEAGAALAVEAGIVAKEPVALKAIPQCNITCMTGQEMKDALAGYLEVLNGFDAQLVGGSLPEDDFYYLP